MTTRPGRTPVRAAHLDKVFSSHDAEIGAKMAQTLAAYHEKWIAPLEQRLEYLESPLWYRLWYRLQLVAVGLRSRFSRMREKSAEVEVAADG